MFITSVRNYDYNEMTNDLLALFKNRRHWQIGFR